MSREISGSGAVMAGGGGGLDFLRSLWAQEKRPLLVFWGGVRGDAVAEIAPKDSLEVDRAWPAG